MSLAINLTSTVPVGVPGLSPNTYSPTKTNLPVSDPLLLTINGKQYTIPFTCIGKITDPDNSCNHLNSASTLWSFNMPYDDSGQIIGTLTSDGQYNIFVGDYRVQVTIKDPFLNSTMPIPVTIDGTTATSGAPVSCKKTSAIVISANWTTYGLSATPALPVTYNVSSPTTQIVYYSTANFKGKQCFVINTAPDSTIATQMNITVSPPDDYGNLGFSYEAFMYPPILQAATLGFYNTSDNSAQYYQFQPGAPFQISQSNSAATVNQNYMLTVCDPLSLVCLQGIGNVFFADAAINTASVFCFQTYEFGQTQHLAILDTSSPTGWYPLEAVIGANVTSYTLHVVKNLDLSLLKSSWGIFQVWGGSATNTTTQYTTTNVSLMCKVGSTLLILNTNTTDNVDGNILTPFTGTINSPIGFVPWSSASTLFSLNLLVTSTSFTPVIHAYAQSYAANCWKGLPPLALTDAGKGFCANSPVVLTQQYKNGKKSFIQETCNGVYDTGCPNIAQVQPDTCSGWLQEAVTQYCAQACSSDVSTFCDQSKLAYCSPTGNRANTAECACLNVYTSSFGLPTRQGMSYNQFVQYLNSDFGLNANTDLNPQCWWDTCDTKGGGGITLSSTSLSCPSAENSCFNAITNLTISPDSTVLLNLRNSCNTSSTSDSSNIFDNPCTSMGNVVNHIKNNPDETTAWVYPNQIDVNQMTLTDKILLYVVAGVTAVVILCTVTLVFVKCYRFYQLQQ
jgi:hypothetical protein